MHGWIPEFESLVNNYLFLNSSLIIIITSTYIDQNYLSDDAIFLLILSKNKVIILLIKPPDTIRDYPFIICGQLFLIIQKFKLQLMISLKLVTFDLKLFKKSTIMEQ